MLRNLEPWASTFGTTCGDAPGVLKKFFKNPHRCPMDARSLLLDLRLPSVHKPRQHNHFIVDPGVPCADCVPRVLDSSFLNPIPAAFPCAATDAEQVHSLMHCKCTRPSAKPRLAGLTVKSKNTSNNGMTKRLASVSLPKAKDTCTCHNGMPKQPTPFHQPCTQPTMLQAHTHTHTRRGTELIHDAARTKQMRTGISTTHTTESTLYATRIQCVLACERKHLAPLHQHRAWSWRPQLSNATTC